VKIEDLKQGDEIYNVFKNEILYYKYLCVLPDNNKYHILINNVKNPIRIYFTDLQEILDLNLKTYKDAAKLLIDNLNKDITFLKSQIDGK